jgi:hypothetical protein
MLTEGRGGRLWCAELAGSTSSAAPAADNALMHLLVPYAAPLSDAGRQALPALKLPHLDQLLNRLTLTRRDDGDELDLTPPHERALARELGLTAGDGYLPWGAHWAARDGIEPGELPWALLTPQHWHLGAEQVTVTDPQALALDEAASRELLGAVRELFESEGFTVRYGAPLRWYLAHPSFDGLQTASPERAIGRNVNDWLRPDPRARLLRRLQSELQMTMYTHPINERREAAGLPAFNSFWISGCGRFQPATVPTDLIVDERLRGPALAADWEGWAEAWRALDAGPLAQMLAIAPSNTTDAASPLRLTLCGERSSAEFTDLPRGVLSRLKSGLSRRFTPPPTTPLLESL